MTEQQQSLRKHLTVLRGNNTDNNQGLFLTQSVNGWLAQASAKPIPQQLFDAFWYEGECCILFADTNLGKSILAMQLGNSLSKGTPIAGFHLGAEPKKVLYLDFELSEKQLENRYSANYKQHYSFDAGFLRAEITFCQELPEAFVDFEAYLRHCLEQEVRRTQAQVLIIDNITYLGAETEKARFALPLMKELKRLQRQYRLSLLVLAHTPKRDATLPIGQNDLQGSKMLINFCDSAFAIGQSHQDRQLRYLKQLKARNTRIVYDQTHVAVCDLVKDHNFLKFVLQDFADESVHLKSFSKEER